MKNRKEAEGEMKRDESSSLKGLCCWKIAMIGKSQISKTSQSLRSQSSKMFFNSSKKTPKKGIAESNEL